MNRPLVALCAITVSGLVSARASAQVAWMSASAGIASVSLARTEGVATVREDGVVGGAGLRGHLGALSVGVAYAEGAIGAAGDRRLFAELGADLSVAATPWLAVRFGPVARLRRWGDEQERWLHWRGALRADLPVAGTPFRASSAVWGASGAVEGVRAGGRGASAGIAWQRGPTTLLVEYAMDELVASGAGNRTLEQVRLEVSIGAGRRPADRE